MRQKARKRKAIRSKLFLSRLRTRTLPHVAHTRVTLTIPWHCLTLLFFFSSFSFKSTIPQKTGYCSQPFEDAKCRTTICTVRHNSLQTNCRLAKNRVEGGKGWQREHVLSHGMHGCWCVNTYVYVAWVEEKNLFVCNSYTGKRKIATVPKDIVIVFLFSFYRTRIYVGMLAI